MALASVTRQIGESLEYIVKRRQRDLDYIKRIHTAEVHWLNVVRLNRDVILKHMPEERRMKRTRRWYVLAMSVGRLLNPSKPVKLVDDVSLMFDQYEQWAHNNKHNLLPVRKGSFFLHPCESKRPGKKLSFYTHLHLPATSIDTQMSYCEVVRVLCDTFSLLYGKLRSERNRHDDVVKLDKRFKALFLQKMAGDLNAIAEPVMKEQVTQLLTHTFHDTDRCSQYNKVYINMLKTTGVKGGAGGGQSEGEKSD